MAVLIVAVSSITPFMAHGAPDAKKSQGRQKKDIHEFLSTRLGSMPLTRDARGSQFLADVNINGVKGFLQLDTGAEYTYIEYDSMDKYGLTARKKKETGRGISGAAKTYWTTIDSFKIGPQIKLGNPTFRVVEAKQLAGDKIDGMIGLDILVPTGALIDFATDRLYYLNDKLDVAKRAQKEGYVAIPLKKGKDGHFLIKCKVAGKEVSMILDTGAQQTVFDEKFIKKAGLETYATDVDVKGAGSRKSSARIVSIPLLEMDQFGLTRFPSLVMDLGSFNKKNENIQGILGTEVLFSSGALFDCKNSVIYLPGKAMAAKDISMLPGEFPMDDAKLKEMYENTPLVIKMRISNLGVDPRVKGSGSDGTSYIGAKVTAKVEKVYKSNDSNIKAGSQIEFWTLIPGKDSAAATARLTEFVRRNPEKLLFLKSFNRADMKVMDQMIFTDGVVRRAHLKRALR